MKQKMQYIQTLKQTLKLNQKLLKSLDFLTDNIDDINKVIQDILETNPFLELKSSKNYDNQQFIESISNKRSLKDDLYYQLYAYTHPYNEDVMTYLIESLDDSGFLSYPLDQYMSDLHIDQDMLDAHLDILRSFEPNGVGASDAIDSILIQLKNNNKNLLILGEGILKEYLQNLINELDLQNRVFLLGFDKNPYKYLSKCYAFVFLSRFEGFSNALIEALVCEKCIISSEHKSGARELLGDDEYGILVWVDDENSTLNAMQKILDDESYVKFYEKKAKIRALDFDKKEISKKLIEKIDEIYEEYKIKEINDEI